jgi:hypothetical protein
MGLMNSITEDPVELPDRTNRRVPVSFLLRPIPGKQGQRAGSG